MKLSKLYSNQPNLFAPVTFAAGLNVILAEIHLKNNTEKDLHNLGKTKFGSLLNFCSLASPKDNFFLYKHNDVFNNFVFYLEIGLLDGTFLTIRRGVKDPSKISLKKHLESLQDFTTLAQKDWDHSQMPFEKAKMLVDGLLSFDSIKPWNFRKALGYLLRDQKDYADVYQLNKFRGKESGWKPYLAHLLGFDANLVLELYEKESQLERMRSEEQTISQELQGTIDDASKIAGMLLLKQEKARKKQEILDSMDFRSLDKGKTKEIVNELDEEIAELNSLRYTLTYNRKRVIESLKDELILFAPDEAKLLFDEVGVYFDGQLKKDFVQLIAFNAAITEERRGYLADEKLEIEARLKEINRRLSALGKRRSENLSFLNGTDIFLKYRQESDELVTLKADIVSLLRKREYIHHLQELRTGIRAIDEEKGHIQTKIERNVDAQHSSGGSLYSTILRYFSEIVQEVIYLPALIDVTANKLGHLKFEAEILDESENSSSADDGHTYRKLLCIAFDMAVLRAYKDVEFPRFVFHDGVLESLDPRKKRNLIEVMRRYSDYGLQQIVTIIQPDLWDMSVGQSIEIADEEIILRLHDDGESGRLFKMKGW